MKFRKEDLMGLTNGNIVISKEILFVYGRFKGEPESIMRVDKGHIFTVTQGFTSDYPSSKITLSCVIDGKIFISKAHLTEVEAALELPPGKRINRKLLL